ncbi:alanine aminotransferase 2 [Scleropages formosus]|uniref:alanine aminotransferase 2 n=1 Tax=Scleropages formosus TaxID=113540 RepID=UPI0010FAA138|nr:alanine aminotransferase 2-like [Scleropages formosus]
MSKINPRVRMIQNSVQANLLQRCNHIREELQQGVKKPYKEVIDICWGDAHSGGTKPLTFVRQVIAVCIYPELLQETTIAPDVKERARRLLRECPGGSVGSYAAAKGIPFVQDGVCEFISKRDGGVPSYPEDIFICSGSQNALMFVLKLLVHGKGLAQTGVLTPIPCYPTFVMGLTELGAAMVPYYLCEDDGWCLHVEELRRALATSRSHCNPRILYVINPGNPTGHVQSRESIEEVIRFAAEEELFIFADEVYQDMMYAEGSQFVSYKKVLFEMGPQYSNTVELASFHSVSKGIMGECGLRCGYVELVNLDPSVKQSVTSAFNTERNTAVIGQIALNIMVDPPKPGDPSYPTFSQEVKSIRDNLVHNVRQVQETVEALPGTSFQAGSGGIYAYLRLDLPQKALLQAKEEGTDPDLMYCSRLLEEEGVCLVVGKEHGQQEGTYHIRICIGTTSTRLKEVLRRLKSFHLRFLNEFS